MSEFHFHAGMDGEQVIRHTPGQSSQAPADVPRVTIGNIQGVTRYEMGNDRGPDYNAPSARQGLGIQANTSRVIPLFELQRV